MTERPLRCYACAEEQPDLLDHLGEPYVCGVIADLRQRIAELEEKLAMLNTPDQADNIVTRNKALADLAVANQRIEELEAKAELLEESKGLCDTALVAACFRCAEMARYRAHVGIDDA